MGAEVDRSDGAAELAELPSQRGAGLAARGQRAVQIKDGEALQQAQRSHLGKNWARKDSGKTVENTKVKAMKT